MQMNTQIFVQEQDDITKLLGQIDKIDLEIRETRKEPTFIKIN